ncbi:hypothetical protein GGE43_004781 [Agrobacterium tumefaciens]|uniref:Nucleotidyltransferase-like domain-containing protein n=1 Tax=Agrobacterium radiobacter TaxID=362 RepID=A0ABR6J6L3_AGRRD|nr:hypothetical protein [Agrobacterium radiobacter]MBB4319631.1 hypothetical protein [Agrobacterium radiobacter]MBB4337837.1 hypothetical protein [Agrobacterium radiobacter]MBB4459473.1 hypothetical protein [Agrobacterium radiobacter]MBB4464028.1 hypothetical protein [Agrobacterium radiobacter]
MIDIYACEIIWRSYIDVSRCSSGNVFNQPVKIDDKRVAQTFPFSTLRKIDDGLQLSEADIPAPERYAVHKLIVASRRRTDALGRAKRDKDLVQASLLSEALVETRQSYLLADAYREAWARGEAWQETILSGLVSMPDNGKLALANALGVTVDRLGKA